MPAETNISRQELVGGGADAHAGMGAGGAAGIAGDERITDRSGVRRGSLENILPGMVASTKSKLETSTSPKNEDAPTNFPDTPQSAERRASGTRFAVPPVPDNKAQPDTSTNSQKRTLDGGLMYVNILGR